MGKELDFNWAEVTEAEVGDIEKDEDPRKPIIPGHYSGMLCDAKIEETKSGALCAIFEYVITDDGDFEDRKIKEWVCLRNKKGAAVGFGQRRLRRRMGLFGVTEDQIKTFKYPEKENEMGDFKNLIDSKVTLEIDQEIATGGEVKGMTVSRIKKVYKRKVA